MPTPPRQRRPGRLARRGAALPVALLVLVVLGVPSVGAFSASRQTFRGGRNALVEQRAFAVAEFGLNQRVADWDARFNLPQAAGGMNVGGMNDQSIYVAAGDTARVRITRLTTMLYHVESVGRASIPSPQLEAVRSVSAIVRLAYPTITPRGAVTAGGSVELQGSSIVDGRDTIPQFDKGGAWDPRQCDGLRGANVPALAVPPGARVDSSSKNIPSPAPRVVFDPAAGDSNTYVRYGTESWNTLRAAARRYPGGGYGTDIQPTDSAGSCWRDNPGTINWGEPFRAAGSVASCQRYFPIVYVDGDLDLQGKGRGQGILMVNGNLRIRGTFDWVGLIIVRDDVDRGNGSATITGAIMARNVNLADGGSTWTGNQTVRYSKCAVESALRGSAMLVRARERSWMQMH